MPVSPRSQHPGGISQQNRVLLEQLHQLPGGAFTADTAASALHFDRDHTSRLLVYLARRGWLSRVRRGLYVAVPLDARRSGEWVEDPWVVAERVFSPCYVGGWSACEHWDLTEQVFRTLVVITARKQRSRSVVIDGQSYRLSVRSETALFGTKVVWRAETRVAVSDPSRTIVDILDDPRLGGGMRNVNDMLGEYLRSEHRDDRLLVEYGDRLGNRTVFKRLGYLLEHSEADATALVEDCLARRSSGLQALDPSVGKSGAILKRWRLRINVALDAPDRQP